MLPILRSPVQRSAMLHPRPPVHQHPPSGGNYHISVIFRMAVTSPISYTSYSQPFSAHLLSYIDIWRQPYLIYQGI